MRPKKCTLVREKNKTQHKYIHNSLQGLFFRLAPRVRPTPRKHSSTDAGLMFGAVQVTLKDRQELPLKHRVYVTQSHPSYFISQHYCDYSMTFVSSL